MAIVKKFKVCRRLGSGVFEKCGTPKFNLSEQKKRMVKRKNSRPKALSDFAKKLLEKQKLKVTYGLKERGLSTYIKKALTSKKETVDFLNSLLEKRLDNVVYRMNLSPTRRMARQIVSHGHVLVNGRKLDVPSYQVRVGDKINIREGSKKNKIFDELPSKKAEKTPNWLDFNASKFEGQIKEEPEVSSVEEFDFKKIIEFYTR